jgi:hypothetical protein
MICNMGLRAAGTPTASRAGMELPLILSLFGAVALALVVPALPGIRR